MFHYEDGDDTGKTATYIKSTLLILGKIVIVTVVALALSITSIDANVVQANAAGSPAVKDPSLKIPSGICQTSLKISSPTDGQSFFENERGPGNDGFVTITFSGSLSNPCRVVFAQLNWYLDGQFLGTGQITHKTLFAGCESYAPHIAKLVATFQKPPTKAQSVTAFTDAGSSSDVASNSISRTVSFTTGAVC